MLRERGLEFPYLNHVQSKSQCHGLGLRSNNIELETPTPFMITALQTIYLPMPAATVASSPSSLSSPPSHLVMPVDGSPPVTPLHFQTVPVLGLFDSGFYLDLLDQFVNGPIE